MVGARLANLKRGDNQYTEVGQICPPSQSEAAEQMQVSPRSYPYRAAVQRKGGLREYARRIGRDHSNVTKWADAASVARKCGNVTTLFDKTYHLSAIHAAPKELWPLFVEALLANEWTVADTKTADTVAEEFGVSRALGFCLGRVLYSRPIKLDNGVATLI